MVRNSELWKNLQGRVDKFVERLELGDEENRGVKRKIPCPWFCFAGVFN
jgi:hypothetical protein